MAAFVICPYCLETLGPIQLQKTCSVCGAVDKSKISFSLGIKRCTAAGCTGGRFTGRRCGRCGKDLPPSIAEYAKYTRLAVVAPSGGGKTVYITTMIEEIYRNSRSLGLNLGAMDADTMAYHTSNVQQLYGMKRNPDGTVAGEIHPLQWSVQDTKRGLGKKVTPTYSLTIFDGAGEDQKDPGDTVTRYIAEAQMILILLDPTKLFGVRSRMSEDEIRKAGGNPADPISRADTRMFIDRIISYVKTATKTNVSHKIDKPVAVVFGKMDMMRRFFPSDSVVFRPSGHVRCGKFDDSESQQVHMEIDYWMADCGDDLSMLFNANFKNWRYFGISSYGEPPASKVQLQEAPKPLRVLDPLIWNMNLEGIFEKV